MTDQFTAPAEGEALVGVTAGVRRSVRLADEEALEAETRRLAALYVRRKCNQTGHAGDPAVCSDPHHRRDADYMAYCLQALGLPLDVPDLTVDETG